MSLVQARWILAVAGIVGCGLVGIIGAGLHPKLSARELAMGPTSGPAARAEAAQSPSPVKIALVGRACTSVGLLVGVAAALIVSAYLSWPWYVSALTGFVSVILIGAVLKFAFRAMVLTGGSS